MKFATLLASSALFLATMTSAQVGVDKCINPGQVAYTIDDGPGPYNDVLLRILKEKNVTATFFITGNAVVNNNKFKLQTILDHGHQLASHTFTHTNFDLFEGNKTAIREDMTRNDALIFAEAKVHPRYMRAPEGSCQAPCQEVMKELGLVISYWNVDTNDWRQAGVKDPKTFIQKSMKEINDKILTADPTQASFILLTHELIDVSVNYLTGAVIDAIRNKGYRFVTMEECIGQAAYLEGSTVPPKPTTVVPPVTPSGTPITPSGAPITPSGAPIVPPPGTSTSPNSVKPSIAGGNDKNGAGIKSAAGWTLFLTVAALGAALF